MISRIVGAMSPRIPFRIFLISLSIKIKGTIFDVCAVLGDPSLFIITSEFPWSANGRAMTMNSNVGKTKLLTNLEKTKILGIGIVGDNAGDLISEAMLALEMNAIPEDIGMTIHPHPTLSETLANASDILTGSITELYIPKRI